MEHPLLAAQSLGRSAHRKATGVMRIGRDHPSLSRCAEVSRLSRGVAIRAQIADNRNHARPCVQRGARGLVHIHRTIASLLPKAVFIFKRRWRWSGQATALTATGQAAAAEFQRYENHGYCVTTPYRDKSQIDVFWENLGDIWAKRPVSRHIACCNAYFY